MGGLAVHCAVLGQPGIRHGYQRGKILCAVCRTLDADLGDGSIAIMPADEDLTWSPGGGGKVGQGILCLQEGCKKNTHQQKTYRPVHKWCYEWATQTPLEAFSRRLVISPICQSW